MVRIFKTRDLRKLYRDSVHVLFSFTSKNKNINTRKRLKSTADKWGRVIRGVIFFVRENLTLIVR